MFPKAIHRHASRERIIGTHQPSREGEAIGGLIVRQRRKDCWNAGHDFLAFLQKIPAHMDKSLSGFGALFHHEGGVFPFGQFRFAFFEAEDFPFQFADGWRDRAIVSGQLRLLFRGALLRRNRE